MGSNKERVYVRGVGFSGLGERELAYPGGKDGLRGSVEREIEVEKDGFRKGKRKVVLVWAGERFFF